MKTHQLALTALATSFVSASAAAAPIAVGMQIGLAPGPTATNDAGNDWFDFSTKNTTYNTIHNLDGVTVDGVSVQVSGNNGFNDAGEDNWVGLATNATDISPNPKAPAEFVDSVTTDLMFNDTVITISGLDPTLTYDLYSVSHGGGAPFDGVTDTHTVTGDVSYGSSSHTRGDARLNGKFHTFLGVSPDVSGTIVLETTQPGAGTNAAFNGLLINVVPEPGSLALMGLGGLCVLRRRRN